MKICKHCSAPIAANRIRCLCAKPKPKRVATHYCWLCHRTLDGKQGLCKPCKQDKAAKAGRKMRGNEPKHSDVEARIKALALLAAESKPLFERED